METSPKRAARNGLTDGWAYSGAQGARKKFLSGAPRAFYAPATVYQACSVILI